MSEAIVVFNAGSTSLKFGAHVASLADIVIAATSAVAGIAMTPLPARMLACMFVASAVFAIVLDFVKLPVFDVPGSPRAGLTAERK
jgi:hypothetical protein